MKIFLCRMRPALGDEQNSPSFSSISVLTSLSSTFSRAYAFLRVSVQLLSHVQLFATPCTAPGFPVQHQLPEPTQTRVYSVGDAIPPSHPLSSLSPPTFNLVQHQGLSNKSVLRIRWPKYWSLSFSISPSNEYPGLISFRTDWLDLLAVKGLSTVFSNTTVQKHQFFRTQLSL